MATYIVAPKCRSTGSVSTNPLLSNQAIRVEIEGKFGFVLLEEAREVKVIIVGPEDLPSIIPASDHVIEPSSDFDSWFPRHGGTDTVAGILKCQESQA